VPDNRRMSAALAPVLQSSGRPASPSIGGIGPGASAIGEPCHRSCRLNPSFEYEHALLREISSAPLGSLVLVASNQSIGVRSRDGSSGNGCQRRKICIRCSGGAAARQRVRAPAEDSYESPLLYTQNVFGDVLPNTFSAGSHAAAPIAGKVLDCPGQLK
jgi:hypothetical protein